MTEGPYGEQSPYQPPGMPAGQPPAHPHPGPPREPTPTNVPTGRPPIPVTVPYPMNAPHPADAPYPAGQQVVAQIGDIIVTPATVYTPVGQCPLRGSQWAITDQTMVEQRIPAWAIVLAILCFFCIFVFSLFFLLAKENVYRGWVVVHVSSGQFNYMSRIPVANQGAVQHLYQQVNYVRLLSTC